MYQLKDFLICGQHHNMQSNMLIHRVQSCIKYISNKYHSCQSALIMLSQPLENTSDWENIIQPLLNTDIRGLRKGEDASSSEGHHQLSWIWSSQHTSDTKLTEGMNEALQIEWCKACTKAQQWQEECILLWEEM
ncbi:hypothetical protein BDN71DRAFT_1427562 [Pleurotus eryngii]|uniref:Uncharacterized protein n=1 Tax=Pleurotus eryngii TaxID=5323 RepID=A0A9P6A5C7_PLEER|nr:hypothetical protein BDN71DRAFT_1427562 [Pleurotus eryngii]